MSILKVLKSGGLHCAGCSALVREDAETCPKCGRGFDRSVISRPQRQKAADTAYATDGIRYYGFTSAGRQKVRLILSDADVDLIRTKGLTVVPAGLMLASVGRRGISGVCKPAADFGIILTPIQKFNYCAFQAHCVYALLARTEFFTRQGQREKVLAEGKHSLAWLAARVALGSDEEADHRASEAALVMDRLAADWERCVCSGRVPESAAMFEMAVAVASIVLDQDNIILGTVLLGGLMEAAIDSSSSAGPSDASFVIELGACSLEDYAVLEDAGTIPQCGKDFERMAISRPLRWNDKDPGNATDGIKYAGLTPAGWQNLRPMLSDAEVGLIRTNRLFVVPAGLLVASVGRAVITGVCKPTREDGVIVLTPSQKLNYCAFEAFLLYDSMCTKGFFTRQGRRQEVLAGWRNDLAWMAAKVALGSDVEADRRAPEAASVMDRLATAWERRVGKDKNHRRDTLREMARVIADAVLGEANDMFGAKLLARLLKLEDSNSASADELSSYFVLEPQILRQEDYAVSCFDKAPELEPQDHAAWYNKGNTLCEMGRHEEAIRCYDKALELNPRSAPTWYAKGLVLDSLGRCDDALHCYDRALELDPRDAATWHGKGCSLGSLGRSDEAIRCFDEALDLDPRLTAALYRKGFCLGGQGRCGEAIGCFDKVLELDPRYILAWFFKGCAQEELGLKVDAVRSYEQFITLAPAQCAKQLEYAQRRVRKLKRK